MRKSGGFATAIALAALFAAVTLTPSYAQQPLNAMSAQPQARPATVHKRMPAHRAHKSANANAAVHAPRRHVVVRRAAPPNGTAIVVVRGARPHAASMHRFDGIWSVTIYTQNGPCDAAYRYPARIYGNQVLQVENQFDYQLNGVVTRNGQISVTVSRGGQSATGYGRLAPTRGGGYWQTSGGQCSGTWMAARRGPTVSAAPAE